MRGGKIVIEQVAADAFGNALGNSLGELAQPSPPLNFGDFKLSMDPSLVPPTRLASGEIPEMQLQLAWADQADSGSSDVPVSEQVVGGSQASEMPQERFAAEYGLTPRTTSPDGRPTVTMNEFIQATGASAALASNGAPNLGPGARPANSESFDEWKKNWLERAGADARHANDVEMQLKTGLGRQKWTSLSSDYQLGATWAFEKADCGDLQAVCNDYDRAIKSRDFSKSMYEQSTNVETLVMTESQKGQMVGQEQLDQWAERWIGADAMFQNYFAPVILGGLAWSQGALGNASSRASWNARDQTGGSPNASATLPDSKVARPSADVNRVADNVLD
jgi:hypothetical protein